MLYGPSKKKPRADKDELFTVQSMMRILWRRSGIVILIMGVLTGATIGFSLAQIPMYEASVTLVVGQERKADIVPATATDLQQVTQTLAKTVDTRTVAEGVISQLGLKMKPKELLERMEVSQISGTQLIRVSYTDPDPEVSQEVADAIGEVFGEQISKMNIVASPITVTVWEKAALPDEPVSPDFVRNIILALVLGALLGSALAVLLEHLNYP